jgi:hypothetical protein
MTIKPKFQATEEVLATRVRHVQFFSVGTGSMLRNDLTPDNAVAVLCCFFANRRTMMAWLLLRWLEGAWSDFKWWCFWTWHQRVMRRNASQIEVILDNQYRAECNAEETDGVEDFIFDEEREEA